MQIRMQILLVNNTRLTYVLSRTVSGLSRRSGQITIAFDGVASI